MSECWTCDELRAERDALRAEVERLGAALKVAEPNQDVREAIHDNVDLLDRAEKAEAEVERLTDLCQRNSDDLAFLDDARALYTETERRCSLMESRATAAEAALREFLAAVEEAAWCQECAIGRADSPPVVKARAALATPNPYGFKR
jgi:hypothetical protein